MLDACNVIAGPTVAATLARFGADVIKLDAARASYDPFTTVVYGLAANRGKARSVLLDLRAPAGQAALAPLLRWADVVTINVPTPQLRELGLAPEQIAAACAAVPPPGGDGGGGGACTAARPPVLVHFDAYGGAAGDAAGARSSAVGYDDCLQASRRRVFFSSSFLHSFLYSG